MKQPNYFIQQKTGHDILTAKEVCDREKEYARKLVEDLRCENTDLSHELGSILQRQYDSYTRNLDYLREKEYITHEEREELFWRFFRTFVAQYYTVYTDENEKLINRIRNYLCREAEDKYAGVLRQIDARNRETLSTDKDCE